VNCRVYRRDFHALLFDTAVTFVLKERLSVALLFLSLPNKNLHIAFMKEIRNTTFWHGNLLERGAETMQIKEISVMRTEYIMLQL